MRFVENPNLPDIDVNLAIVDGRIGNSAEKKLNAAGIKTLRLKPHSSLYEAVSGHPDILLHHIGGNTILYAPGTDQILLDNLASYGFKLIMGNSILKPSYPADIAYNAARIGGYYFHNLKYTDPVLRKLLEGKGVEPVHVGQGYSKCSILPVDSTSIVTSDAGIARIAEKKGFDVLLVDYERSIRLPGLNYGFIGGASGKLGKNVCAINGNIRKLDCFSVFSSFLFKKGIKIFELSDEYVTDIGSILPIGTFYHL